MVYDRSTIRSLLNESTDVSSHILDSLPELEADAARFHLAISTWVGLLVDSNHPEGIKRACSQAANEGIDLVMECLRGSGRPALKAARSLFELRLTTVDIVHDPTQLQRYEDHQWVVWKLNLDLESAKPARHRGDAHRRRKAEREIRPEFDRVVASYGPAFRRSWRTESLADVARRLGMMRDYDFYRLASGVLHGSSGGVIGQFVIESVEGGDVPVHRTGLAIGLCPDAWRAGLRHLRGIVEESSSLLGAGGTEELLFAISALDHRSQDFEDFMIQFDREMWATVDRGTIDAIAVIDLRGHCRWFVRDTRRNVLREAVPPASGVVSPEQRSAIDRFCDLRRRGASIDGVSADETMTVQLFGVHLEPQPGSKWRHSGLLMQQRRFDPGWPGFEIRPYEDPGS